MFVSADQIMLAKSRMKLDRVKILTPDKIIAKFMKGDVTEQSWIQSKNDVLVWLIESQNLDIDLSIDQKSKCHACGGRGFDILLFKTELIKCQLSIVTSPNGKRFYHGCNGEGWKLSECRDCRGTGKVGEIPCPTCMDKRTGICSGTYQYRPTKGYKGREAFKGIKCIKCGGEGKIPKLVQRDTQIESVTVCKKCSGSGIHTSLHTQILDLPSSEKLKEMVAKT